MKIEQMYTGCLAQGAYYIVSNGEAAIIDPLRDIEPYLERIKKDGVVLKYIFETHFHADFVSGHIDLSKKTNAPIVYGPTATPAFEHIAATDGQFFQIGNLQMKAIHTPGHTIESTCYLLLDESGNEAAIFTGDTLFLGDVGRPDLAQKNNDYHQDELAGLLYHSLYEKILPLPDSLIVYPAHGAGSACGKNMMKERFDSLGNQKRVNYALNQPDKASFIKAVTDGLLPPPTYFGMNVQLNKKGYQSFDKSIQSGMKALSPEVFEILANETGALILDTRAGTDFALAFIPKSINIGLDGDFAPWVGALVGDIYQPLLLVTDEDKLEETIIRLGRVGFDHILGHLSGGIGAWLLSGKEIDMVPQIQPENFAINFSEKHLIVDVRKETEYAAEHVIEAYSKPLAAINQWIRDINPDTHFYLHCAGGYRSIIAASILLSRGYRNFTEIVGGFNAIKKNNIPTTDFICQTKLCSN